MDTNGAGAKLGSIILDIFLSPLDKRLGIVGHGLNGPFLGGRAPWIAVTNVMGMTLAERVRDLVAHRMNCIAALPSPQGIFDALPEMPHLSPPRP
jgi:hypothetical protein